jgi:hypothetical protein
MHPYRHADSILSYRRTEVASVPFNRHAFEHPGVQFQKIVGVRKKSGGERAEDRSNGGATVLPPDVATEVKKPKAPKPIGAKARQIPFWHSIAAVGLNLAVKSRSTLSAQILHASRWESGSVAVDTEVPVTLVATRLPTNRRRSIFIAPSRFTRCHHL